MITLKKCLILLYLQTKRHLHLEIPTERSSQETPKLALKQEVSPLTTQELLVLPFHLIAKTLFQHLLTTLQLFGTSLMELREF